MDAKLYLTIAAVVAILYALGFLLIPVQASLIPQRLRGATRRLKSAVLRCCGFGVGAGRVVRERFSGLGGGARSSNR